MKQVSRVFVQMFAHRRVGFSRPMFATDFSRWFKTLQGTLSRLQPDLEYENHRLSDRALIRTIHHDRSIKDGGST